MGEKKWITPFKKQSGPISTHLLKPSLEITSEIAITELDEEIILETQCFVVLGASINMSQIGMVMGIVSSMLPQLRTANSSIPINDSSGSWIAALPGFALLIGNLMNSTLMAKIGRKKTNLISICFVIIGWVCLVAAQNISWILVARLLQGISTGMSSNLTPIIIGEVTGPKNRGAFTILMSLIMAAGTLTVHTLGSYTTWRMTSLVITFVSVVDLLIVALSPETPSWLADQGKYEECEKVFRWLRGEEEIEELNRLIQASTINRQSGHANNSISNRLTGFLSIAKKKEFFKPVIIMIHLYAVGQWGGINLLAPYVVDMVRYSIGEDVNLALIIVSVDVQRIISSVFAVFIIRKVSRRTMLFTSCGINALVFLITAGYVYAKNVFSFDYPAIGILLLHALMMTVAIGSLPLPFTIAGEIFALRYRSLSSGITSIFYSSSIFLPIKTFPFLLKTIGLYGAYCLYAVIMIYCLTVVWFLLPETKDRTLQEIEEEFKGKIVDDDLKAAEPLTIIKNVDYK